ncbi:MAG: hypothetical protein JW810_12105 [Sedimentisphaerales bacterium]|nr:hypothetical protein [Sedimentisphaerales bacterium]
MGLLKASEFQHGAPRAQLFNLGDIEAEARSILAEARRQRDQVLEQARRQAEQARQQAEREGYQAGQARGLTEGRAQGQREAFDQARDEFARQNESLVQGLKAVLQEFDGQKRQILWRAQQQTVALAVAIARRVIKQAGLIPGRVAAENVRAALELITKDTDLTIQVHPQDLAHLQAVREDPAGCLSGYDHVRLEASESLAPGDCRLATEQGRIDGRLDTQIRRIAEELLTDESSGDDGADKSVPADEFDRAKPAAGEPADETKAES